VRLLSRYLLAQLAAPFAFALAALTSIMLLNQIALRFGDLVGKGLAWSLIGEVFLLSLPFIVAMTLPMAVLLAVLYAFTTLASSNEITAMRASGISIGRLLRPVLVAAVVLTAVDFVFVDQGLPAANLRLKALIFDIGRKRPTLNLREQALNEVPPSSLFLRAGRIDPASGRLRDVTLYDMSGTKARQVIYADSGRMGFEPNLTDLYLTLHSGSILQFEAPDPALLQLTYFTENTLRVRNVGNTLERSFEDTPKGEREMTTCEMRVLAGDTTAALDRMRRRQAERLEEDLRQLLGLPDAPAVDTTRAPFTPWCVRLRGLGRNLLPAQAEAQQGAQDSLRQARLRKRLKEKRDRTPAQAAGVRDSLRLASPPGWDNLGDNRARHLSLSNWVDVANSAENIRSARRTADGLLVEIHKKYAITVACLVFVLVGIPLALRFPRGGMGLVLGGGLGIFALYYISLTAGEPLADAGILPPAAVMWAPNVVFTIVGVIGLLHVNRELGSTRGGDLAELVELVRRRVMRWRTR